MRVAILAAKLKHILLMRECLAVVLGCCVVFDLTISVVIFSQVRSRFFVRFLPHFSHFVATCLAAMSTEAENTRKLLAGVHGDENRAIFNAYMKSGDPMGAMLWAAFRIR